MNRRRVCGTLGFAQPLTAYAYRIHSIESFGREYLSVWPNVKFRLRWMRCSCFHLPLQFYFAYRCAVGVVRTHQLSMRQKEERIWRKKNETKCLFVLEICSFIYCCCCCQAIHVVPFHFASFSRRRVFIRNGRLRSCPIAMHSRVHQPKFHISHSMNFTREPKIPGTTWIFLLLFFRVDRLWF